MTIFGLTGSGGGIAADGKGAETVVSAPTDPGGSYAAGEGGLLILEATPNAASSFFLNDTGYYANVGTIGFRDPGGLVSAQLDNVAVGSAIELPGTAVTSVNLGASSITIATNKDTTTFSNVSYFSGEAVTGYTAAFDAVSGLEKVTFTGRIPG